MASKINETIIIKSNMNLNELEKAQNTIKELDHKHELRARKTPIAESLGKAFVIYKKTFSERSFGKLKTLNNYVFNKNLSKKEILTKGILDRNSVSIKDLKHFLNEKREEIKNSIDNELKDLEDDLKMKINQDHKSISEISTQNKKIKSEEPEGITQDYDLKKLADEYGLKDITFEDLNHEEEIKTKNQINNSEEFEANFLDGELLKNINELEKLEFFPEDIKTVKETHSEVHGTNSNKPGAAAVKAELDKMLYELENLKNGVEYTPTKINIEERPSEVNPNLTQELDNIRDMKSNFAEMGIYTYEPKGYQYKTEVLKSKPRNGISKNKSNSIKEELKNFKNTLQEKIGLNKNIPPLELTTQKKVSFKEESITDTQNIKKDINGKELANDFREITLTKGVTDGIAISTALRTKLIKNKNNLELTISAETIESTILKFKSIVINLLHDKNSILKNLSLEDRNFLSLHYDILPAQIQKDLVKLHPSILEDKVSAQEDKNDSTSI